MANIEQRSETSYRITVSAGYDMNGKKIRKHKTINVDPLLSPRKLERELQTQAALFEKEVESGLFLDGQQLSFAEFAERWFKDYASKQLAPKTLERYRFFLDSRVLPALGHIKIQKLQPTHLMNFYNNLAEEGVRMDVKYSVKPEFLGLIKERDLRVVDLSRMSCLAGESIRRIKNGASVTSQTVDKLCNSLSIKPDDYFDKKESGTLSGQTIRHHHRLISSILTSAVQWQVILSNPASRLKPPKVDKHEAGHLEEDQTDLMLSLIENEPLKYKVAFAFAIFSGARPGEICGLEWSDINFDNGLIRIIRSSQYVKGLGVITKSPKNKSSERVIAMPQIVLDILSEYKAWQNEERLKCGDLWQDHDRLFTQWNGTPIFPNTLSMEFKKFKHRVGLPDEVTFHGLRHTNASLLIGQGVNVQTVAKRLGHTKATTTTSIYSHFLKRPDREAADILQDLFTKDKKEKTRKA